MCRIDKARTAKIYSEADRSKEKEVEERRWRVYTFFYKNSLSDSDDIKDLNFEYKSKRRQRRKESFSSMKEKQFAINIKEKNVEKIKRYYILIKHSINVQTLMKFDSHSTC